MFGFLKDKLKKVVDVFTKATTEPAPEEKPQEKPKRPKPAEKQKPVAKATPQKIPSKHKEPTKVEKKAEPQAAKKKEIAQHKEMPKVMATESPAHKPAPAPVEELVFEKQAEPEKPLSAPEQKKMSFLDRLLGKKKEEEVPAAKVEPTPQEPKQGGAKTDTEPKEESGGFFGKLKAAITTKKINREEFDTIFQDLEMELLENNVALEVVDKMKEDLWEGLSTERFNRFSPEKRVQAALIDSISGLFMEPWDILEAAKKKDLYIICAVGINGSGKTTTLAKLAQYFKDNKLEPVLAAGDTFRAAAIQQLEEHANKIGVKIIKQQYGADAAAVAFDAIQYAKANACRVVLIDTAGRLHSNTNLMEELKKIVRVAKPDATVFIGEATTGNDCVEQAVQFQHAVPLDGIILSKVDVDERGGAALSISYVTKKPILFFGTGQAYKDLEPFDKEKVVEQLTI